MQDFESDVENLLGKYLEFEEKLLQIQDILSQSLISSYFSYIFSISISKSSIA